MTEIEIKCILTQDFGTNCYIVVDESNKNTIIIDPGFNDEQGKKVIETIVKRNLNVLYIINTHGHSDHISGNMLMKKSTNGIVISHKADSHFFDTPWQYFEEIGKFGTPCFKCGSTNEPVIEIEDLKALISCFNCGPLFYVYSQEIPDRYVVNNENINFGDINIKVIHTPGHTEGGICLYIKEHNILFTGDTLFAGSVGRTDLPFASNKKLKNSLKNIVKFPGKTIVYSGHGEITTLAKERINNSFLSSIN